MARVAAPAMAVPIPITVATCTAVNDVANAMLAAVVIAAIALKPAITPLTKTMAAARPPITTPIVTISGALSLANLANLDSKPTAKAMTGKNPLPMLVLASLICAVKMRCLFAAPSAVRAKSPCCSVVCSRMIACAARLLFCGVNASLVVLTRPSSKAFVRSAASLSKIPKRRNGSASPRRPAPKASTASSGLVLLNDARSVARVVNFTAMLPRSVPVRPAALPNTPNVPAALRASVCDCPKDVAAVLEKSIIDVVASPKIMAVLLVSSLKSLAILAAPNAATARPPSAAAAGRNAFLRA